MSRHAAARRLARRSLESRVSQNVDPWLDHARLHALPGAAAQIAASAAIPASHSAPPLAAPSSACGL
eukprot:21717-Pelagococcus_subviridis.AAC.2